MERLKHLKQLLAQCCPGLEVRKDEPMSRHTSFRIGGPAALMALPANRQQAVQALRCAAQAGVEPFFLGNGSNLLVSDEGVERFLVKLQPSFQGIRREGNCLIAGAEVTLARLAVFARDEELTGLEFAHGIPGCLGGAVTMNAGAYGGEMAQVVRSVTCLDLNGEEQEVTQFDFGYRHSAFSDGKRLIVAVRLELAPGNRNEIAARMEELMARRQEKQPLEYPSAGSVFKRPQGYFAGALVEQCGLKGLAVGGAQVSEKHAGFIINRGGATCRDVFGLVEQIQKTVLEQTGVTLEMEIRRLY